MDGMQEPDSATPLDLGQGARPEDAFELWTRPLCMKTWGSPYGVQKILWFPCTETEDPYALGLQPYFTVTIIGYVLRYYQGTAKIDGKTAISGQTTLAASSTATSVVLTGDDGTKYTVKLGTQAAGTVPFTIDTAGLKIPAGTYKLSVETSSKEAPPVDVQGRLNSVRLSAAGGVVLNVSNIGEIAPTSITAFNGKSASAIQ